MATQATSLPGAAAAWTQGVEPRHRLATLGRLARRNPLGVVALIVVLTFVTLGAVEVISHEVFGTVLAPSNPKEIHAEVQLQGPSWAHPFGTNQRGNDMLSRVIAGSRVSFLIGFMALTIGFIPGALLGIISGYYQRWIDYLIQRTGEAWTAFPVLFLYLAFITALGPGLKTI